MPFTTTQTAAMGSTQQDIDAAAQQLTGVLNQVNATMAAVAGGWETVGSSTFFQAMTLFEQDLDATIRELLQLAENLGLSRSIYTAQLTAEQDMVHKFNGLISSVPSAAGAGAVGPAVTPTVSA